MRQVLICGALVVTLAMGVRHGFGMWLQPITQANGWSRETFSFAAYEAVAAGAAIVTGPDSGNIAAFVEAGGHGRVLRDEAELEAAFETGEILELARARRPREAYDIAYSNLTLDLLDAAG